MTLGPKTTLDSFFQHLIRLDSCLDHEYHYFKGRTCWRSNSEENERTSTRRPYNFLLIQFVWTERRKKNFGRWVTNKTRYFLWEFILTKLKKNGKTGRTSTTSSHFMRVAMKNEYHLQLKNLYKYNHFMTVSHVENEINENTPTRASTKSTSFYGYYTNFLQETED